VSRRKHTSPVCYLSMVRIVLVLPHGQRHPHPRHPRVLRMFQRGIGRFKFIIAYDWAGMVRPRAVEAIPSTPTTMIPMMLMTTPTTITTMHSSIQPSQISHPPHKSMPLPIFKTSPRSSPPLPPINPAIIPPVIHPIPVSIYIPPVHPRRRGVIWCGIPMRRKKKKRRRM